MFKYLCIIIGLILYILFHNMNIEGFNVGIPGIHILMYTKPVDGECVKEEKCERISSTPGAGIRDMCGEQCREARDTRECNNYHTPKICLQECLLSEIKDSETTDTKNLKQDGFEKINELVDVENDEYFNEFKELINMPIVSHRQQMEYSIEHKKISFSEYLLKNYMGKKMNGNIKILANGIFYINNHIIFFKYIDNVQTRISEKETEKEIPAKFYTYYNNFADKRMYSHFPRLHVDAQNVRPYEILKNDPFNHLKNDSFLSKKTFQCNKLLSDRPEIEYNTSLQLLGNNMKGINGIEYNDNIVFINIWLLFYGTDNVETLGFIDAIDDDNPHLYDDTLVEMLQDNENMEKITSFITEPGQYPNIYNALTQETTDSKPNIDIDKLYTFDMVEGDALVFRTDIPHIGFPPREDDGLRMSLECRYAYLEEPFSIVSMFGIHDSPPPAPSDPILTLDDPITFNKVIPEDQRDIVYNYFNNEFKLFAKIHNLLYSEPLKNIHLFKTFIDEIPYEEYSYDMNNIEKEIVMTSFLEMVYIKGIKY